MPKLAHQDFCLQKGACQAAIAITEDGNDVVQQHYEHLESYIGYDMISHALSAWYREIKSR